MKMKYTLVNLGAIALGVACLVIGSLMPSNGVAVVGVGGWLLGYAKQRLGDVSLGGRDR